MIVFGTSLKCQCDIVVHAREEGLNERFESVIK